MTSGDDTASTDERASAELTSIALDSRALQVLAHPLRSRLLTSLRAEGPATATALAETLDTNTGATSYHLRKLASVGLVEETGEGRGRERWWRAATQLHSWTERDVADDPDGRAATDWLRRHYFQYFAERYAAWLEDQSSWPLEWQDAAGGSDYLLTVSAARLRRLQDEVVALFQRYGDPDPADDAPAVQVSVNLHAFPVVSRARRGALPPPPDQLMGPAAAVAARPAAVTARAEAAPAAISPAPAKLSTADTELPVEGAGHD